MDQKIGGIAGSAILLTEGQTATFVYVDGTEGWINIQETSNSVTGQTFIIRYRRNNNNFR